MTELAPNELTLTPDQRRRLGQVYRLILGWRRERINGMQKLPQEQPKGGQVQSAQIDSDPAGPTESES